jgi:Flp pilus assembly CpaF family ATPase
MPADPPNGRRYATLPTTGALTAAPFPGNGRHGVPQQRTPPGVPDSRQADPFDDGDVRALHRRVSAELAERLNSARDVSPEYRRQAGTQIASRHVTTWVDAQAQTGRRLNGAQEEALRDAVLARLFGLGRLQPLIDDETVENIMVLGPRKTRVERAGGVVTDGPPAADSDEELIELLQRAAADNGQGERSLTPTKPTLHLRLNDGSRLAAMAWVTPWPTAVIRRHRTRDVDLDELVRLGAIDPLLKEFLCAAMSARLNIMIAGLQMAGKTTLLRGLASEIPSTEWFATMENELELHLHETGRHPWVVPIEAREGHGDRGADGRPVGEVTIGNLLPDMLRMSMTRVIVGEVRSSEIVPMLRAMGTSRGSLCTIHARTAANVFDRIVELALEYGTHMSEALAYRLATNSLDYIVYVEMREIPLGGGRTQRVRYVSHVVEIDSIGEGGRPAINTVFGPGPDGRAVPHVSPGRTLPALQANGFNIGLLQHRAGQWQPQNRERP